MLSNGLQRRGYLLVSLFLFLSPHATQGLETDNYFLWGKALVDSGDKANHTMNRILDLWTLKANQSRKSRSCRDFAKGLYQEFLAIRNQTKANWDPFRAEMIPSKNSELDEFFKSHSIYRSFFGTFKGSFTHLAGGISINGVILGVDKIAHFVLLGYEYFEIYQKSLSSSRDPEQALLAAFDYGMKTELGRLGLWFVAFSYGDLEADYQGLLFYNDLCQGPHPYVIQHQGQWQRSARVFDWAEYVNPYFDESFNPNGHEEKKWKLIQPFVKGYCEKLTDPRVVVQREFYKESFEKSISQQYFETLEAQGRTPKRRMIEEICP